MAHAATLSALLPHDAMYEILLRLPAKDLCRLRGVCRPWRSLLSDPQFITAHAARHPTPPLVVAGYHTAYRDDGVVCEIMDLSGNVLRRVRARGRNEWERATSVHLDFVCHDNMTTGEVVALPEGFAKEHAGHGRDILDYKSMAALGQVASTGEYKVLRVLDIDSRYFPAEQLCEIFTLDGSSSSHVGWRGKKPAPIPVSISRWRSVAVNGIVYFFGRDDRLDQIASFDLEREEWRLDLRGPDYQQFRTDELSMAAVNGSLVVVHRYLFSYIDLWFLVDLERCLWVKQHSIRLQLRDFTSTRPLLVLNDGRLVLVHIGNARSLLKIYNPKTDTSTHRAELGLCFAAGLYSGSLLSLANRCIM